MGRGFYIRHSEAVPGLPGDSPLSALGREQASRTAAWLTGRDVGVIVASPLRRARQTAEIIGNRLGLGVAIDARLRERMNWGDVPGQTFPAFLALWEETRRDRDRVPFPGAPTAREAGDRLRDVMLEHRDAKPAIVAHGGILQCLVDNLNELGRTGERDRLDVRHASVTTYEVQAGTVRLLTVGWLPDTAADRDPG